MSERRCPSCGALVAADAEWCGQCYSSLGATPPSTAGRGRPPGTTSGPAPTPAGRFAPAAEKRDGPPAVWRCPTCDAENPLDADVCDTCGAPFGRLFEEPSALPSVSSGAAAAWSLLLPGLGHWFAGRRADAAARFVLAAWVGGMLLVLLASRGGKGGVGALGGLVGLFALGAVALWAESALDASRAVEGLPPVVSSRALLWASVALVGLSIMLATVLALSGMRSGPGGPVQ